MDEAPISRVGGGIVHNSAENGDAIGNLFSAHPVRLKIGADVYRPFTTTESTMARTASSLARIVAPSPPSAGML
jgi:hypothetical protein